MKGLPIAMIVWLYFDTAEIGEPIEVEWQRTMRGGSWVLVSQLQAVIAKYDVPPLTLAAMLLIDQVVLVFTISASHTQ